MGRKGRYDEEAPLSQDELTAPPADAAGETPIDSETAAVAPATSDDEIITVSIPIVTMEDRAKAGELYLTLAYNGEAAEANFPVISDSGEFIRYVYAQRGGITEALTYDVASRLLASGKGFSVAGYVEIR